MITTFPKAKGCYKEDTDQLFPTSAGDRLRKTPLHLQQRRFKLDTGYTFSNYKGSEAVEWMSRETEEPALLKNFKNSFLTCLPAMSLPCCRGDGLN